MPSAYFTLESFETDLATVRRAWHDAGRDAAGPLLTVLESRTATVGLTAEAFAAQRPPLERLARYAELGAQRVVIGVPVEDPAAILPILDLVACLRDEVA
jgi:hypothetical protein